MRLFLLAVLAVAACSVRGSPGPPSLEAIGADHLTRDLAALSADRMRGRETGTRDEFRAAAWLAERAREAGLEPAGEDGTFYQFVPLHHSRFAESSRVVLGGRPLVLWRDAVLSGGTAPFTVARVSLDLPVVFASDTEHAGPDLEGHAVVVPLAPPREIPGAQVSVREFRYGVQAMREQGAEWARRGATAVILIADSMAGAGLEFFGQTAGRGRFTLDSTGSGPPSQADQPSPPVLLVRPGGVAPGAARLTIDAPIERFTIPSVNVIGVIPGTDPVLRKEYILFSAHLDHDGVGTPVAGDSVWNGADDNATGSVALLAIARAWTRHPGRRSALFVWHGAEERGLLGSRWHAAHPVVPATAIVAVLNADMIGRNHPDTAALLGAQPPHRNSVELTEAALEANRLSARFVLDSTWDHPDHPEGFYFRSDHAPYAKAGIPALFFTTRLHPDYHTPRDESGRIDVDKLRRMTAWMHLTGWLVANAPRRPALTP